MNEPTARTHSLRVLHAGALDSIHLRRWVDLSAELGHDVAVAGHLRPGFESAVAPPIDVHVAPQLRWASTRHAQFTGRRVDQALAALPNAAVEVPMCAAWLRRLVRRLRPDVVHTQWLPHWGAAAALGAGVPVVAGAMGSDVYAVRGLHRRLSRLASARADWVAAPSPHAAAALANPRAVHLEQGIDLDFFRPPAPAERDAARDRLGLPAGPVVLSFRAATPVYDLPLVAESFRRLLARQPTATLVMVHGLLPLDGETAAALAGMGDSVHVVGQASEEEMRTWFRAADVGISVPLSDGSPNSVWESLATATPVVCSDLPQLRERLGPDDGVVFAPRDPDAVAAALESALTASGLGAGGRRWCEANVDRRDSMRRLDALYRGVVAGSEAERPLADAAPQAP